MRQRGAAARSIATTRSSNRNSAPLAAAFSAAPYVMPYGSQIAPVSAMSAPRTSEESAGSIARASSASTMRSPSMPLARPRASSSSNPASSSSENAATIDPLR